MWYRTGDVGRFDERGNLVLSGRTKNIIVLPNGLNVFPEDIENALSDVGLDQAVVVETAPGRIEADRPFARRTARVDCHHPAIQPPENGEEMAALRKRIEPMIKAGKRDAQPAPADRRLPSLA